MRLALPALALFTIIFVVQAASTHQPPPLRGLPITARATLKGTVTLTGTPPAGIAASNAALAGQIAAHEHAAICTAAPNEQQEQQSWVISPKGGVAHVAVFVKPEPGFYFELTAADLKPFQAGGAKHEASVDQPFCTFVPHLLVIFPSCYKDGKLTPSGQVVKIKNSAPIAHNSMWGGTSKNPGSNLILTSKSEMIIPVVADRIPLPLKCSMHPWMEGRIWALDTPFATVTDKEGAFEIKDVPAGIKLRLFAWHDSGWVSEGRFDGEPIQLEAGKVFEKNFQVKAK